MRVILAFRLKKQPQNCVFFYNSAWYCFLGTIPLPQSCLLIGCKVSWQCHRRSGTPEWWDCYRISWSRVAHIQSPPLSIAPMTGTQIPRLNCPWPWTWQCGKLTPWIWDQSLALFLSAPLAGEQVTPRFTTTSRVILLLFKTNPYLMKFLILFKKIRNNGN